MMSDANQQPYNPQSAEQPRYHVHHSYIWMSGITTTISLFVIFFFVGGPVALGGTLSGFGGSMLVLGGSFFLLIVVAALVFGFSYLSWKNLHYELGEKEFSLYSGILNKKKVHVPYQRVQSVNQHAGLLQRFLGVCTVNIDTAGGSSNKAIVIPYIQNYMAEWLRSELFSRKQFILTGQASDQEQVQVAAHRQSGARMDNVLDAPAEIMSDVRGVFGGEAPYAGRVSYEYGMSNKELFLTGLSNNTGVVLAFVTIIASAFSIVSNVLESSVGQYIYSEGLALATNAFPDRLIWVVAGSMILVAACIWLFSVIGTCISYGGFKATRRGTRIEVEHGLLQHRFHGVDVDRVQSVIIKQSLIRRIMGYCELSLGKIDAMEDSDQSQNDQGQLQQQGLVVHPFVKIKRVPEILSGIIPEFADVPTEQILLPKRAKYRALIRRVIWHGSGFWLAVVVALTQIVFNVTATVSDAAFAPILSYVNMGALVLYALCLIIAAVEFVGALMWFRGSSFAYNRSFMQVTNGGYSRESVSLPRKKIQFGFTRTNPWQRMSHVASINARTAAGIQGSTMRLLDVDENEAQKWLDWVRPGQNMIQ